MRPELQSAMPTQPDGDVLRAAVLQQGQDDDVDGGVAGRLPSELLHVAPPRVERLPEDEDGDVDDDEDADGDVQLPLLQLLTHTQHTGMRAKWFTVGNN